MSEQSARVQAAEAADHAELQAIYGRIVRSADDAAALLIAEYESETGRLATAEDWAFAREYVASPSSPGPSET